jgi:hypothetical protein
MIITLLRVKAGLVLCFFSLFSTVLGSGFGGQERAHRKTLCFGMWVIFSEIRFHLGKKWRICLARRHLLRRLEFGPEIPTLKDPKSHYAGSRGIHRDRRPRWTKMKRIEESVQKIPKVTATSGRASWHSPVSTQPSFPLQDKWVQTAQTAQTKDPRPLVWWKLRPVRLDGNRDWLHAAAIVELCWTACAPWCDVFLYILVL